MTRSLLIGGTPDGRMTEERRVLDAHFPQFTLTDTKATGRLRTFANRSYQLTIALAANYPHVLPVITPDGWKPRSNPHMISGNLCVMTATQWKSFMSVAFVVAKSALWLNKYEVYIDKGIWPGPEQHSHGTVYNVRKWWHDL